jgi:replicative DNA helicase
VGARDREAAGRGVMRPVSAILTELDAELQQGTATDLVPVPTGFTPLDMVLGGGLHAGGLTLIGGSPGVGKTIMGLQWARNIAADGTDVVYVCFEHDEHELLVRLMSMELEDVPDEAAEAVRDAVVTSAASAGTGLRQILRDTAAAEEVLKRVDAYADRLHLVRAAGAHTGVEQLAGYLDDVEAERCVLVVDYLQKVAVHPEPPTEAEKVTRSVEGLKDLALEREIPIVAIVAVEMVGLKDRRLRMHHFRGSSALVFEADVALVLADKVNTVAKAHLAYDPLRARTFQDWVVLTVEKNRSGPSFIDLEFRKDFSHFRFDPHGGIVQETLADELLDEV